MVGTYNRSACCARKISCRWKITMNLQKSENRSVPSQYGLDNQSLIHWTCVSERYAGAQGGALLVVVEMMRPLLGSIHLNGFVLLSE